MYKLKEDMDLVNEMFGNQFLAYYTDVIIYMCQIPGILLASYFHETVASTICFAIPNLCTWVIAAEFHSSVAKTFMKWCKTCRLHFTDNCAQMKLLAVKNELHSEPIAVSCKFFTITYGFIASVRKFKSILNYKSWVKLHFFPA